MGGRARREVRAALEHEGWEVHDGGEPGVVDLEAHKEPLLWLVCAVSRLHGETLEQAWPPGRVVGHLVARARERTATPVVGVATGEGVEFYSARDMAPLRAR